MSESWRVVTICSIAPLAHSLVDAVREPRSRSGRAARRRGATRDHEPPPHLILTDANAPKGLDLLLARDKHSIEPLLRAYEPDLMLCWGFPWKIPQAALDVPRLASVNCHPALLPRHRGPIPLAWALRDGDAVWGCTWHYMDAELDTGNILVQGTVPIEDDDVDIARVLGEAAGERRLAAAARPRAGGGRRSRRRAADRGRELGRALRGRRLRPRRLELVRPARSTTRCGPGISRSASPGSAHRSPSSTASRSFCCRRGSPIPGGDARRVECGDGPIWVVASEPV